MEQICLQIVSSKALIMIILCCSVWKEHHTEVVSRGSTGELTVDPQTSYWGVHFILWFTTTHHQNVSCTPCCSQKLQVTLSGSYLGWATAGRWNPRARISPEPYTAQFTLTAIESGRDFFVFFWVYFKWFYVYSMSLCTKTLHSADQSFLKVVSHSCYWLQKVQTAVTLVKKLKQSWVISHQDLTIFHHFIGL